MKSSLLDKNTPFVAREASDLAVLAKKLKEAGSLFEKLEVLNGSSKVRNFLKEPSPIRTFLCGLSPECEIVLKSVIALGQAERVFALTSVEEECSIRLRKLVENLLPVERFYAEMGGIVGYHGMMLQFLSSPDSQEIPSSTIFHRPEGFSIDADTFEVRKMILSGVEKMGELAEIYPLGGAADRLRLQDEKTGTPLPAACLLFCGKTLLEGMISDLQAREYVHHKLFGRQLTTPIAMMTSCEKNNHEQILAICAQKKWFGRPQSSFRLFCQPSVPAMDREGNWCLIGPMQPLLKPGGHGVMWKLARDEGIFDWLFSLDRKKALIRQINNPIAGIDYGLLAFAGAGIAQDKIFGFASCPRLIKAMEGINVLVEKQNEGSFEYQLTNIEYCDFKKFGIVDEAVAADSPFSKFSSNTNILFADLKAVISALAHSPIPGMLVNLKKTAFRNEAGEVKEQEIARLESTMQNIADSFMEIFHRPLNGEEKERLKTFITYNERNKTISTAKREFVLGASLLETPEGCFLDVLKNARDLLVENCGMQAPEVNDPSAFFIQGPSFIFLYHPSLGPIYSIIAQKIRGGRLAKGSELQLEIAEVELDNLQLDGSLQIYADCPMGHKDEQGYLIFSERAGKCVLKNVLIVNEGIDRDAPNVFWRNEIFRKETCQIEIRGDGEFYAEDIVLDGDLYIVVEAGTQVTAYRENGKLLFDKKEITAPSWHWRYHQNEENRLELKKA